MPAQLQEDNVTYEHVNVAVAPKSPSADARSRSGHGAQEANLSKPAL